MCFGKQEKTWSWLRLGIFAVGLVLTILCFKINWIAVSITALVSVVGFTQTVIHHTDWKDQLDFAQYRKTVLQESSHQPTFSQTSVRTSVRPANPTTAHTLPSMLDSGPTWPLTDQELEDLDIYSNSLGLFGLLNRTSTNQGARRLRDWLESPLLSSEAITQRQQAAQWLSQHTQARVTLLASALPLRKRSHDLDNLITQLEHLPSNWHHPAFAGIKLWSCICVCVVVYSIVAFMTGTFEGLIFAGLILLINSLVWALFRKPLVRVRHLIAPFISLTPAMRSFLYHTEHTARTLPDETCLAMLKTSFQNVLDRCRIQSVCEWLDWASIGAIIRTQFNLVFFYDLHVSEAILKRLEPTRDILLNGLCSLADIEALNSLACFSNESPVTTWPNYVTNSELTITQAHHPLIDSQTSVPNDITLTPHQHVWLITGPNAAGKSTYLRTIGINLLLAQIGSAVTAQSMQFSALRLITDVRVRDDLAKHESYFLSEVRRLRRIVMDNNTDIPLFCLIDEPFRGTNSPERTAAGIALLEHLLLSKHLILLATHEEQLAQTALQSKAAQNHHFQETLLAKGITFEYTLRPGPATTKTAIRILEQEHYPQSLVTRAKQLMQE